LPRGAIIGLPLENQGALLGRSILSLPAREPCGSRRFVVCGAGPNGAGVAMWSMRCAVASKVGT
jgi:hypothetical protein